MYHTNVAAINLFDGNKWAIEAMNHGAWYYYDNSNNGHTEICFSNSEITPQWAFYGVDRLGNETICA